MPGLRSDGRGPVEVRPRQRAHRRDRMPRAPIVHPAPSPAPILGLLAELVGDGSMVLDPFAGIGRIHQLEDLDRGIITEGVEIEPEWAALDPRTRLGDATALPEHWAAAFDAVVTSPCYGNR